MAFELIAEGTSLVLKLSETVDLSETSEIKDAIKNEPKAGFKVLAMDASEVEYMDSSAVALMIFSKRIAQENQMLFEITAISKASRKIIVLAGLGKVFNLPEAAPESASDAEPEPEPEPEPNPASSQEESEVNLDMGSSDEEESEVESANKIESNDVLIDITENIASVDNDLKSKDSNLSEDSKSDENKDFDFKPGTFN